ncbi:TPA: hypothetical protein I7257_02235 [Vibrio vulnificus]|nr:hypothetical protein [Vibrio vulnificus]
MDEETHLIAMRFSALIVFKTSEISRWAQEHLRPQALVISDGLACFRGIEDTQTFHKAFNTGAVPTSVELLYFKWVETMISNVKTQSMRLIRDRAKALAKVSR